MTARPAPAVMARRSRPTGLAGVLWMWLASRVIVISTVLVSGWAARARPDVLDREGPVGWCVQRMCQWDFSWYAMLADRGYPAPGEAPAAWAFFPGYPTAVRGVSALLGGNRCLAGLLIGTLAGFAAIALVYRLTLDVTGDRRAAWWAGALLAVTPMTVFLSAAYTEPVFLALIAGAWLAARWERWGYAGVLAGLACTVRVNGLLVVAGLVVMAVLAAHRRGAWWRLRPGMLALGLGPAFVLVWMSHVHAVTGRWDGWSHAQAEGWGRAIAAPWVGAHDALGRLAVADSWHLVLSRALDILAMLVVVAVPVVLARRRQWPEAAYAALTALSLLASTIWLSAPRYVLGLLPLHVLLGAWAARTNPARGWWAVGACAVVAVAGAVTWGAGWWLA